MMGVVSVSTAAIVVDPIVRADLVGTTLFTASALASAILFTGPVRAVGVVVALGLFAIGIFAFLWSYITAVQRSRADNIAVAQLYFLAGGSTPKPVRRVMLGAMTVQIVVAFATAIVRSRTDGRAGSTLAFGILVPMFGIGLNGLWCSKHGSFSAREHEREQQIEPNSESVPPSDDEMEQNSPHG